MFDANKLVKERNEQYGAAWKKTGNMMWCVADQVNEFLISAPDLYYNWVIILNKLGRLLADPWNIDSWKDIAGYATLVVNHLEAEREEKASGSLPSK